MGHYRVFSVNAAGHFVRSDVIEAADDEAAIEQARTMLSVDKLELWQEKRLIVILDPEAE